MAKLVGDEDRMLCLQASERSAMNGVSVALGEEFKVFRDQVQDKESGASFYHIQVGKKKGFIRATYVASITASLAVSCAYYYQ